MSTQSIPTIDYALDHAPRAGRSVERSLTAPRTLPALIAQFLERRRARYELGKLSDHELADIGLTRGQIQAAVHGRTA